MQQQLHSYAFQLQEGFKGSQIGCHPSNPQFYFSTFSLKTPHKSLLYTLSYDEQNPRKSLLTHQQIPGKIQGIYTYKDYFLLTIKKEQQYEIYKVSYPDEESKSPVPELITSQQEPINNILSTKSQTILCGSSKITTFNKDQPTKKDTLLQFQDKIIKYSTVDHIHQYLAYIIDQKIMVTDKSCKKDKYTIESRSNQKILSIDFNPNKQYYLMCSYYDSLKFYDIRKGNIPVKCLDDHHSLILNAKYNHSHDELIVSAYDDGTVGLWRMSSVSSVPLAKDEDTLVQLYDEHEDSVYEVNWSYFSPWIFGTLGYAANNFVVNIVPSAEKYRILL